MVAGFYMIVNLVYTLAYKPIYNILTWTDWFSYALVAGAFAIALVTFGLGLLVYDCCCK